MRVAIVHDWLVTYGGAERFLRQLLIIFPGADLFALIDFFPEEKRVHLFGKRAETTWMQKLPFVKHKYPFYLPLMPLAIEQLDLTGYDLVISSSHAVAKGVICSPDSLHICYCHSPFRYAFDMQFSYLKKLRGVKKWAAIALLHRLRLWDMRAANGVDHFATNSHFVARRIAKAYRREAEVVYSGIEIDQFEYKKMKRKNLYVTASRMVPYKRFDLIIDAFNQMPDQRLIVIGKGPEEKALKKRAGKTIEFVGALSAEKLSETMGNASAFVFAAQEDFGLLPLEAQACGTPVIAYGKGGALETVRGLHEERPTGCFFYEQTAEALVAAVRLFEKQTIFSQHCREMAENFTDTLFRQHFKHFVMEKYESSYLGRRQRHEAMAPLSL